MYSSHRINGIRGRSNHIPNNSPHNHRKYRRNFRRNNSCRKSLHMHYRLRHNKGKCLHNSHMYCILHKSAAQWNQRNLCNIPHSILKILCSRSIDNNFHNSHRHILSKLLHILHKYQHNRCKIHSLDKTLLHNFHMRRIGYKSVSLEIQRIPCNSHHSILKYLCSRSIDYNIHKSRQHNIYIYPCN